MDSFRCVDRWVARLKSNIASLVRNPRAVLFMVSVWGGWGLITGLAFSLGAGVWAGLKFGAAIGAGLFVYHLLFGILFGFEEEQE